MSAFKALLFIGCFLLLLFLLEKRYDTMFPDFNAAQFQELLHSTDPKDTIILGSSTAVYGYDMAQMPDAYNFGLMGAQPHFYLHWYKIFEKHYKTPSTVIISLDWFSAGSNRGSNLVALEQYSRYLPWDALLPYFWQSNNKVMMLMNMSRLIGIGPDVRYFFYKRDDPQMDAYNRGYMPLVAQIDDEEPIRKSTINPEFIKDLSDLINMVESNGSKVILVQMPVYKYENIENMQDPFSAFAKERDVPILNYSNLNLDKDMFADWSHLNQKGSQVFTQKFQNDIAALLRE